MTLTGVGPGLSAIRCAAAVRYRSADLDFAVLVLTLEAQIHPAFVAGVGCLLGGVEDVGEVFA